MANATHSYDFFFQTTFSVFAESPRATGKNFFMK
jgi:hypothetical protein